VTGRLNKQIAAAIGLSENTVKIHRGHISRKMGAASLVELVLMAEKLKGLASAMGKSQVP
jgi:FixJ family two-component response regulator